MSAVFHPQRNSQGALVHLLSMNGLTSEDFMTIMQTAERFLELVDNSQAPKKLPLLRGTSVFNVFFENSTRTRTTFEIAAKSLSADVTNLNIASSSQSKGESLLDTMDNLAAMNADIFVVRHAQSGAPYLIADHFKEQGKDHIHVINAGDGRHSHPTQGLLDLFTIWHDVVKKRGKSFSDLKVALVGDILHSRVARSDSAALRTMGVKDIRLIGPKTLLPYDASLISPNCYSSMEEGLQGVDVIIMLRLQKERMRGMFIPSEEAYFYSYGLTQKRLQLAAPDAIVMHPGPLNRGVEIESAVADGAQSVILRQVRFGIAVRMAVMSLLAGPNKV